LDLETFTEKLKLNEIEYVKKIDEMTEKYDGTVKELTYLRANVSK
jgi:hypothetical protein